MLIAHLPAGLLVTRACLKGFSVPRRFVKQIFLIGLFGSIFPDLDLLYFFTIDQRQHHHHSYWTHIPFFWLAVYVAIIPWILLFRLQKAFVILTVLFFNIIVHLLLDTVTGGIYWAEPFNSNYFQIINVDARYDNWMLNFVLHWSFLIEVAIVIIACRALLNSRSAWNKNNVLFVE
jgi:inner membrane protein